MLRFDRRAGSGLLIGTLAMFFALDVAFLVSLIPGLAFAPLALGQAILEVIPGPLSVLLIELLGHWAERLLIAAVLVLYLIAGAATGYAAVAQRHGDRIVLALGALPWVATLIAGYLFAGARFELFAVVVNSGAGAATLFASLSFLYSSTQTARPDHALEPERRRALIGAMAFAALIAVGGATLGPTLGIARAAGENILQSARRLRFRESPAPSDTRFDEIGELTPRVTSNADHYTVDTALIRPQVDVSRWRLDIGGTVDAPFSISYEELLDLEAVEQMHTLVCISNEIGGNLIGTALWTGVPLADLLARARPRAESFDVVLRSVDGYSDSIRIGKAMEPKTLVAYLMNGYTLPVEHGFPARMLVPDIYGMKNVKWLHSIEVVNFDYTGYWQQRGWNDVAVVNTNSRIDLPNRTVRWSGGEVTVAGIAFAGARGVSRVEVSTDGGSTWGNADLEPALTALTWRRWLYRWTPAAAGQQRIQVRATDGTGAMETATRREPFPSGATGYDTVELDIQQV